jgi:hypothetical protein
MNRRVIAIRASALSDFLDCPARTEGEATAPGGGFLRGGPLPAELESADRAALR